MSNEHEEELARLRAELDQAFESVKALAKGTRMMYVELQEQGFDEDQAMQLSVTWIRAMLQKGGEE